MTKWVGVKVREIDGYKLWYSGHNRARNRVRIFVDKGLVNQVVEVRRKRDCIMSIKLVVGVSFATLKSLEREAAHLVRDALIPHHE